MAVQRLTRKLIDLGLTEEEAEIYVFLTQTGPAPARMVALRFETNRIRAYRSLNALEEKGLVQRIMGRPMKFTATPFTEVLRKSIREMRHRLADLEENEEVTIGDWENLTRGVERSLQEPKFRIYQGRQQVYELLVQ
ncbi:MAG TPA: helix-turn-helix domain-containing protein, partial [Patescibacteria group bacterium]|nr:helix-turn-helix domain-containing protein [Patescibacteria group bacterium]